MIYLFKGEIKIAFKFCVHKFTSNFFKFIKQSSRMYLATQELFITNTKNFAQTRKLWEIDFLKK